MQTSGRPFLKKPELECACCVKGRFISGRSSLKKVKLECPCCVKTEVQLRQVSSEEGKA